MYYLTKKNNSRDELYHYGILGQRWGIRRYQNPDGTYTTAGKARRVKDYKKINERFYGNGGNKAELYKERRAISKEILNNISSKDRTELDSLVRRSIKNNYKSGITTDYGLGESSSSRKKAEAMAKEFLGEKQNETINTMNRQEPLYKTLASDFIHESEENNILLLW